MCYTRHQCSSDLSLFLLWDSLKDTPSYLYLEAAARHASWKSKNDIRRHGKNVTAINNYEIAHYCEEKNKSAALEEKLKEVIVEQDEMKKCMGLMMKEIQRLSKLVPDNYLVSMHLDLDYKIIPAVFGCYWLYATGSTLQDYMHLDSNCHSFMTPGL
ncbi:hypothetical protein Tco_0991499 [Tanacetum coccineum]|uniref:Uncharacterized protein n=1 Tax=Tanacetum coccineum TaxID=301880 RepID=A0ABQ5F0N3_9ASTR